MTGIEISSNFAVRITGNLDSKCKRVLMRSTCLSRFQTFRFLAWTSGPYHQSKQQIVENSDIVCYVLINVEYFQALGHCGKAMFLVVSLRRVAFGHISKHGSLRLISSSGNGARTPNLNCHVRSTKERVRYRIDYKWGNWDFGLKTRNCKQTSMPFCCWESIDFIAKLVCKRPNNREELGGINQPHSLFNWIGDKMFGRKQIILGLPDSYNH